MPDSRGLVVGRRRSQPLSEHLQQPGVGGIVLVGAVTSLNATYFELETKEVLDLLCSNDLESRLAGIRRFVDDCFSV
ncbi:MAG TPA: hypothetical protein VHE81_07380, partial [Lacipirellulaceae bacterium]|nr:hypothetical protein [Lacipirellulaceae bacterium]